MGFIYRLQLYNKADIFTLKLTYRDILYLLIKLFTNVGLLYSSRL